MIKQILLIWAVLSWVQPAYSEDMTGLDVMRLVVSRDDGNDLIQHMKQRLIDKRGNVRERLMMSFSKDYGEDSKSITYFLQPANVRDTAMLTWDYADDNRDDDQWLYLPALKKVRRISSSDRGDYFMGTDFTFEDIKSTPTLGDYQWTLAGSENIHGADVWVVDAEPKSKALKKNLGYSKVRYYVRKDIHMYIKVDFWDIKGKELKHLVSTDIKQVQGIWTAMQGVMSNVQTHHRTELTFSEQQYNTNLSNRMFSERMLKRGYRGQ